MGHWWAHLYMYLLKISFSVIILFMKLCGPPQNGSNNVQLTASLDVFLQPKKGVSPITYKPPLPLPATRPTVLARSQPGLAQVSRSSVSNIPTTRSQAARTLATRPQLDSVPKHQRRKSVDTTTVAKIAR